MGMVTTLSPKRKRGDFTFALLISLLCSGSATAQVSSPPSALPLNSAFREDAKPAEARLFNLPSVNDPRPQPVRATAAAVTTPIESRVVGESVAPPLFTSDGAVAAMQPAQIVGPVFPLDEPPSAPPFSWRPSYVHPGAKPGSLQAVVGRATYLPRLDDDGFGMTTLTQSATFAVPPFIYGSPILITPSYSGHFTDGPGQAPVPPRLMDIELEFKYMKQATKRLGFELAVAPSYYSDGSNDSSEAYRTTARAIAAWQWRPTVQLIFGGAYLGREDYPAVPIGGVIWKPSDDWRHELIFPRPRIYYRWSDYADVQQWLYLGGEFGGNTWAVDRPGDIPDKLTYSDLRLFVGWERKKTQGLNLRFEAGWVFDRRVEYLSGFPGVDPSDTFMIRGESSY